MNIYLDDVRDTPEGFVRTYTVGQTCDLLRENAGNVETLSLDNDLGIDGWEEEGRFVIYWLAEREALEGKNYWPKSICIHSANPVAREWMTAMVNRYAPA